MAPRENEKYIRQHIPKSDRKAALHALTELSERHEIMNSVNRL